MRALAVIVLTASAMPASADPISDASALASKRLAAQRISDTAASLVALEEAIQPSLAILDDVIARGAPMQQLQALHVKADLYGGLVVRMRAAAPVIRSTTIGGDLELAHERHDAIEVAVAPWRASARGAYAEILRLALAHPDFLANPVVAIEVRNAESAESGGVAAR